MTALDPSTIIPVRILDARERSRRAVTAGRAANSALALALNLAAVSGLLALATPLDRRTAEPQAIAVDLVSEPPGAAGPKLAETPAPQPKPAEAPVRTDPAPEKTSATQPKPADRTAADPKPTDKDPAQAAPTSPVPADTPPSLEGDRNPTPRLVEAPPDPTRAAQQATKNLAANAEPKPADVPKPTEVPPPPVPPVLAAQTASDDPLAEPRLTATPPVPVPAEASAEEKREAENTAKLAAVLPFGPTLMTDMSRAPLSGQGSSESQQYRGAVYGSFRKADDVVAEAQARHLRGRAVVVFSIDAAGALATIRIAVSSGDPAVDEAAMTIIRRSAPFPPPPPGAQRTFSPAIALGLDDP